MVGSVAYQATIFIRAIGWGILVFWFYDIWMFLWRRHRMGEIFYGIIAGILLFLFEQWFDYGSIRSYSILGWLTGSILYRQWIRKYLKKLSKWWKHFLEKYLKSR